MGRWTATMLLAASTVLARAEAQPSESQPLENHYQAAHTALAKGNTSRAELELKLGLQDNPLDSESHLMLASLLAQQGEHDQAIVGFQRAVALDPSRLEALYNLGTMLLWRGEPAKAARLLESALAIGPDHVPSYNNLAKAYFVAGLPELAVATYREALRLDPTNAIALGNLALLAEATGQSQAAAREQAPAANPGAVALDPGQETLDDPEASALRELLRDLAYVMVERRGGLLTLAGWTSGPKEREMLDRILARRPEVLDLTTDDSGDPHRMLEVDATLFVVLRLDSRTVGFDFLRFVELSFQFFASDHTREGTGLAAPGTIEAVSELAQQGWLLVAAVDYDVNIANATDERVAVLARPHLSTLSGTPASFLAGGEFIFTVSGLNSGDIKPYPFGTTLTVTPTLLRTPGEDGSPRVHMRVEAGRTSVLQALTSTDPSDSVIFDKVNVTSEAVLGLGQTLILSGLNQRESRSGTTGVPVLRSIPILKYLFSTKRTVEGYSAVIILLTPRDPAFMDERNRRSIAAFVEQRRAFIQAMQSGEEEMRRFRERYPDWNQVAPNRFASHFFLMNNSELYRNVSGQDLASEALDFELLGRAPRKKGKRGGEN